MSVVRLLRGGCALACLLALGLAGCTGTPTPAGEPTRSLTPSPSPTTSAKATTGTTADNITATRHFSTWLLTAVPMPRTARRWHHAPIPHYRHGSLGIGPADESFTRTTWWTVPLSPTAFGAWLLHHETHGLRAETDSGGSVESMGVWEHDQAFSAASTPAHTRGWVNFGFLPHGAGVVVRVDTFVGARFARSVLVPEDTTAVTIRRTERRLAQHSRPHTEVRTVTDPRAVAHLVAMINRLPGAMTVPFVASCPGALSERSYRLIFTSTHGTYTATLPTTLCWPRLTLTRDGVTVDPPLDPGRRFVPAADRYLAGSG